ncbi:MAG: GspE/PulE family protein [Candidatus Omnitrophica bacterium]|nr:GspE/PulE family protein [Candidatus Omnitrophota bacterium]MDD5080970.1 GspE/PulE family protein [Candidatus Omnitrophota bacterium]MDD5440613.1 GspE/PulE family protein [Candidatus Omnitrophota bacterium]
MEKLSSLQKKHLHTLCKNNYYPPIDLSSCIINDDILDYIPEKIAKTHNVIPISCMGYVLTIAIVDPLNIATIDSLKLITLMEISPVIADEQQLKAAIELNYKRKKEAEPDTSLIPEEPGDTPQGFDQFQREQIDVDNVAKLSKETRIINAVNKILSDAVTMRASDIHIEPFENEVRVRYRIDGILHETKVVEKQFQPAVIARIKIMSRLDITQRRIPQDGRFSFKTKTKELDVRVSTVPVDFGEKIVMRLLDKENINLSIESLGFSEAAYKAFTDAIKKPLGMILLTGPTGSGKTTTLYTLLNTLNTESRHLLTIEDPVEYNLWGVSQVPVRHEIGLDFSQILRSTLRQSPDVIMLGEIRDSETIDIAMKAALTGHIVFSTLHTNDAPSAISRLINMGVAPFLISFSINLIAAQRLVRRICPACRESYQQDLSGNTEIPLQYRKKDAILYRGKGCSECSNTGYKGRIAVIEALSFDNTIRDMIIRKKSTEEIRDYALKNTTMLSLREDASEKCFKGETTLEEVLRVTTNI